MCHFGKFGQLILIILLFLSFLLFFVVINNHKNVKTNTHIWG